MYHGIVEGYYGKPFTAKQRKILLDELSPLENPAYFYAPKDDPGHRLLWRKPYSEQEWMPLANCMGGDTAFFFSLSPWKFKDNEWGMAREKLLRAADSGAAGLSILFDDVPDKSAGKLAERQLNFAVQALEGVDLPVILCPSVYCGEFLERFAQAEEYLQVWRKQIPGGWSSFWTGPMVVSETMSDLKLAEELLGARPVIWDNIHATDYCLRRIYLAGLSGRVQKEYSWFINPSEIFPAALHGVMELKAALGHSREWPEMLGEHSRGWELLQEFHYLPWRAGDTGGEILARLSSALNGNGIGDALVWLNEAVPELSSFVESVPSIEGGWELLPVARDLYRSLSVIRRALLTDDPEASLHYFMHTRLPYENPAAALAAEKR
ncbi:MAG: beta-N-acetylglucosaminidase domain-containing protein [Candidatus Fermentibacteria bacterium]|nr:beta-N-acetylglucosaminidase domain-containing protein [Candidatus Fermentibacteria bacterium]